jgi:hypothetical protein
MFIIIAVSSVDYFRGINFVFIKGDNCKQLINTLFFINI